MAPQSKHDPVAVEAYLATLPTDKREALERLRRFIQQTVPGIQERISYGTTVMFSLRRDLVGFASQPKHLSFFTASPHLMTRIKTDISPTHRISGATIHFSPENPLATALVKKILKARVAENATATAPSTRKPPATASVRRAAKKRCAATWRSSHRPLGYAQCGCSRSSSEGEFRRDWPRVS